LDSESDITLLAYLDFAHRRYLLFSETDSNFFLPNHYKVVVLTWGTKASYHLIIYALRVRYSEILGSYFFIKICAMMSSLRGSVQKKKVWRSYPGKRFQNLVGTELAMDAV
jgi:hypothetical protein